MMKRPHPHIVLWELTTACNMRCRHCCAEKWSRSPEELSTDEALELCDQIIELGVEHVGFSGGEPLLRKDWPTLARRLSEGGCEVSMVTNGWRLDDEALERATSCGVNTIQISLDGLEESHDACRRRGSYAKISRAVATMKRHGMRTAVTTTVTRSNRDDLSGLEETLVDWGVDLWQIQLGLPLGNLAENLDEVLSPQEIPAVLDVAYSALQRGDIRPTIGDNLGYNTKATNCLLSFEPGRPARFDGCPAGRSVLSIRHDGTVCGCLALSNPQFDEGSIREKSLEEFWFAPGAFAWNRERSRDDLTGFCGKCQFGEHCLGGCTAARLSLCDSQSENTHCAHRVTMERLFEKVDAVDDAAILAERGQRCQELGLVEVAERCLERSRALSNTS